MKTTVLFLTDHAVDAYLEMFMGELSLRADEFFSTDSTCNAHLAACPILSQFIISLQDVA